MGIVAKEKKSRVNDPQHSRTLSWFCFIILPFSWAHVRIEKRMKGRFYCLVDKSLHGWLSICVKSVESIFSTTVILVILQCFLSHRQQPWIWAVKSAITKMRTRQATKVPRSWCAKKDMWSARSDPTLQRNRMRHGHPWSSLPTTEFMVWRACVRR